MTHHAYFFCPAFPSDHHLIELSPEESHHLRNVLRMKTGSEIFLMDGQGTVAKARVEQLGKKNQGVICNLIEKKTFPPLIPHFVLVVAPPHNQQMNFIVRAATELGVQGIVPLITNRSESIPTKIPDRWIQITISAIKQSRNPFLPIIERPITIHEFLLQHRYASGFFGACKSCPSLFRDHTYQISGDKIYFCIGPEGGFTQEEEELLLSHGFYPIQLAPYILRVETAAIAALTWLNGQYRMNL